MRLTKLAHPRIQARVEISIRYSLMIWKRPRKSWSKEALTVLMYMPTKTRIKLTLKKMKMVSDL